MWRRWLQGVVFVCDMCDLFLVFLMCPVCLWVVRAACRTATMMAPLLLLTSGSVRCEAVLHSCGTKPVGGWVPTCDSAHSWGLYSAASLGHQAIDTVPLSHIILTVSEPVLALL